MMQKNIIKQKGAYSIYREKVDDTTYSHNSELNRNLDSFSVKLIKAAGIVGIVLGCLILIAFWVWVIRWLYKIW
jgi:hypothetical protein